MDGGIEERFFSRGAHTINDKTDEVNGNFHYSIIELCIFYPHCNTNMYY